MMYTFDVLLQPEEAASLYFRVVYQEKIFVPLGRGQASRAAGVCYTKRPLPEYPRKLRRVRQG